MKTYLHGAYNTVLARHKDVTAGWAAILNANALNQPYNVTPFSYTGTENVSAGFFTSTAATTDITDWVLIEVRDSTVINASISSTTLTVNTVSGGQLKVGSSITGTGVSANTTITAFLSGTGGTGTYTVSPGQTVASTTMKTFNTVLRRAAFILEDGRIVDLNGTSDLSFRTLANGNYYVVIRHRNHLPVRMSASTTLDGTLGYVATQYDFSSAQAKAYQSPSITNNAAMRDLTGGKFGMWGANGNRDNQVRATGPLA